MRRVRGFSGIDRRDMGLQLVERNGSRLKQIASLADLCRFRLERGPVKNNRSHCGFPGLRKCRANADTDAQSCCGNNQVSFSYHGFPLAFPWLSLVIKMK